MLVNDFDKVISETTADFVKNPESAQEDQTPAEILEEAKEVLDEATQIVCRELDKAQSGE